MANEEQEDVCYMDVQGYANSYKGRNQILRLVHIANHCIGGMFYGDLMELEALRLAHDLMRWGRYACDVNLYRRVVRQINGRLGEAYLEDHLYVKRCRKVIQGMQLPKPHETDQFSFVYDDMCYQTGCIREFRPFYQRAQQIEASMSTILVALETKEFSEARYRTLIQIAYYNQSEQYKFKLDCASSLADLGEGKYKNAAEGFLKLVKDVNKYDYSEVLSSEDVVTYGLLCAMATFDQDKLREALREVTEPVYGVVDHLKEIIDPYSVVFYLTDIIKHLLDEQFATCMKLLEKQKPRLCLDIYLFPHVESLVSQIKDVAVAGYLQNFSSVMLDHYTLGWVDSQNEVKRVMLDSGGLVVPKSQAIRLIETGKVKGSIYTDATGRTFFKSE